MASAPALYDPLGTGLVVAGGQGPIQGDPEPNLQMAIGGYLTTGDLDPYQTPDLGGLPEMAAEVWFAATTVAPTGGDYLMFGPESATGTGIRQWWITLDAGGTITANVRKSAPATVSVTSPNPLVATLWYHIVATVDAGTLSLYINGSSVASAAFAGTVQGAGRFAGAGTNDFVLGDPGGSVNYFYFSDLAIYRTGLSAARVAAHYTAGAARGYQQQKSGARVNAALDSVSSHAPRRVQAGVRDVAPVYLQGQAPLDEIRAARGAEAVDAAFFTAADGTLVFLDSAHRSSSPYNTIQATFGDASGELAYVTIEHDYADSYIANEWNVTRVGSAQVAGQTQTASDSTSIARYFKRPQSLTGLMTVSDADSATVAAAMLAKYKDPLYRITGISFTTIDPNVAEAVLQRELMDKVRILRTPPGGGSRIQQDVFIQKIEISGAEGEPWTVRWAVSPL